MNHAVLSSAITRLKKHPAATVMVSGESMMMIKKRLVGTEWWKSARMRTALLRDFFLGELKTNVKKM